MTAGEESYKSKCLSFPVFSLAWWTMKRNTSRHCVIPSEVCLIALASGGLILVLPFEHACFQVLRT